MVPARTKRSTKPSEKSSNFHYHDLNGCICLSNLVTDSRFSHVCFKVVTVIKRRMPSLGMNLYDYLGTWHIYDVKKADWVKAFMVEVFHHQGNSLDHTCVKITLYANWDILHMNNSDNSSKRCKKNPPLQDSNSSMRHAFALSLVLWDSCFLHAHIAYASSTSKSKRVQ
jgi:hypothetical protein